MEYDELEIYSEDSFEHMVECWKERERQLAINAARRLQAELKSGIRWWLKFSLVVAGTTAAAFIMGYALARLS